MLLFTWVPLPRARNDTKGAAQSTASCLHFSPDKSLWKIAIFGNFQGWQPRHFSGKSNKAWANRSLIVWDKMTVLPSHQLSGIAHLEKIWPNLLILTLKQTFWASLAPPDERMCKILRLLIEVDYECSYFLWLWQVSSPLLLPCFFLNLSHGHFCSQRFLLNFFKFREFIPQKGVFCCFVSLLGKFGVKMFRRSSQLRYWKDVANQLFEPVPLNRILGTPPWAGPAIRSTATLVRRENHQRGKGETHVKCWSKYLLQVI